MTTEEKIAKTVQLYQAIAYLWGTPPPVLESIHFVEPRIFHTLPRNTIETHKAIESISFDMPHTAATIDAGEMFLRLYCGHNDECPLIDTEGL